MKKILLIDDSPLALAITKEVIEDLGYECDTALSGEEGLDKYKNNRPDCVIVDLVMPRMDGFQVVGELLKLDLKVKIIALSASLTKENLDRLEGFNVKHYVNKPVSEDKIKQILKEIL